MESAGNAVTLHVPMLIVYFSQIKEFYDMLNRIWGGKKSLTLYFEWNQKNTEIISCLKISTHLDPNVKDS